MEPSLILVAILVVAVLGRADSVAVAAGGLLMVRLLQVDRYVFPVVAKTGVFWGLVLLIAAILIPLADGSTRLSDLGQVFTSWVGIVALLLALGTTYLSGQGLQFLTGGHEDVMPALILGSVAAAAFLGGVPVGPLITSGILAVAARLIVRG
jgi:uncharacterized membrane protein (DUF441 family)